MQNVQHPIFQSLLMSIFHLLLTILPWIAAVGFAFGADATKPRRPNVVFILADDLGYGDLGCYGQKNIKTPRLDRMAAEGMRFTQYYAGSTVCAPSRCVLMTGLHTGHCYIRGNRRDNLRPQDLTVAEVFKQAGYATGHVGKWGLGHEGSTGLPTRQGFDEFFGYLGQNHAHNYYPTFLWRNENRVRLANEVPKESKDGAGVATRRVEYSADLIADEAIRFVERNRERPFFLYYAPTIPHANNEAGKAGMEVPDLGEYRNRDWPAGVKAHAAMITRMDSQIGRLFDRLKELGLDENTVVFFSSDNGPHRESGYDPDANDSNGPLRGIKRSMHDGGIRVPLVVRWPARIKPGSVSEFVGYFADFLPTAAELSGVQPPVNTDGVSIVPTLTGDGGKQKQHAYLYWEFYEQRGGRAVRMGPWKGVRPTWHAPLALYDMTRDIGEDHNIAAQHPDIVAKIESIMQRTHVSAKEWKIPNP
jgi:arylsulfatase A-like enzyme